MKIVNWRELSMLASTVTFLREKNTKAEILRMTRTHLAKVGGMSDVQKLCTLVSIVSRWVNE